MKSLMPLVFIGISVGLFFMVADPQYQKTKAINETIKENNRLLDLAAQLREKKENLRNKFNQIDNDDRQKLEKILPDTVDNVRLILDISNIADEYGIAITNIGITERDEQDNSVVDRTNEGYGKINLSFSVSSRYEVFKEFMQSLENSLRLVDINSFSVNAGEGVFYNFDVSLNTYWLR